MIDIGNSNNIEDIMLGCSEHLLSEISDILYDQDLVDIDSFTYPQKENEVFIVNSYQTVLKNKKHYATINYKVLIVPEINFFDPVDEQNYKRNKTIKEVIS